MNILATSFYDFPQDPVGFINSLDYSARGRAVSNRYGSPPLPAWETITSVRVYTLLFCCGDETPQTKGNLGESLFCLMFPEGIHNGQAETWQQGAGVAAGTRIGSLYPQPKHRAGKADWERCGSFHSQSLTPVTYFVPQGNAS